MTNIDHNNYKKHTKNYKRITEKNRRHEKNKEEKQLISGDRTKQPPERERERLGVFKIIITLYQSYFSIKTGVQNIT